MKKIIKGIKILNEVYRQAKAGAEEAGAIMMP